MDISMKSLITGVERLGLDTQSLRDFMIAQRSSQVSEDQYKHILVTLQVQLDKALSGAAEPAAVKLILGRLDKKLQSDLAGKPVPVEKQVTLTEQELQNLLKSVSNQASTPAAPEVKDSALSEEILHQLRMMNEEVKGLKSAKFHTISNVGEVSSRSADSDGPEPVFINPVDESKVQELESNITIEEKQSKRNLKDKVKRLKELKRDKEG